MVPRIDEMYEKGSAKMLPKKWWLTATAEENLIFWIGNQ